jgi:hypothetical protein
MKDLSDDRSPLLQATVLTTLSSKERQTVNVFLLCAVVN